jgi:RNA-directed DNA polymerase
MRDIPLLVSFPHSHQVLSVLSNELSFSDRESRSSQALFDRGLPPLVNSKVLPYLFGVSPKLVAAMGKFPERYYRIFDIPKKSGGRRSIEAPRRFIKVFQRWILRHILASEKLSTFVNGFVKGKNIFDNARPHVHGKNLMVVDIENFFPSVKLAKIVDVFEHLGFPTDVAQQLAALCTINGHLSQGAPTSPTLSNLVFRPIDRELSQLAHTWKCNYTRYADDLAFSGSRVFKKSDINEVHTLLRRYGYSINRVKSRIIGAGGQQIVAGVVVNRVPQPVRIKRRTWRALFHRALKHPNEFRERKSYLLGVAALVKQYDEPLSREYRRIASRVP